MMESGGTTAPLTETCKLEFYSSLKRVSGRVEGRGDGEGSTGWVDGFNRGDFQCQGPCVRGSR